MRSIYSFNQAVLVLFLAYAYLGGTASFLVYQLKTTPGHAFSSKLPAHHHSNEPRLVYAILFNILSMVYYNKRVDAFLPAAGWYYPFCAIWWHSLSFANTHTCWQRLSSIQILSTNFATGCGRYFSLSRSLILVIIVYVSRILVI